MQTAGVHMINSKVEPAPKVIKTNNREVQNHNSQ